MVILYDKYEKLKSCYTLNEYSTTEIGKRGKISFSFDKRSLDSSNSDIDIQQTRLIATKNVTEK